MRSTSVTALQLDPDRDLRTEATPRKGRKVSEDDMRVGVLVRTIEQEIIPRLMLAHRATPACLDVPQAVDGLSALDVEMFTRLVLSPDEELAQACVLALRQKGVPAEDICLGLLAPAARRLGELWEQDLCDFTDVTYGLGRLQQVLRNLGPSFEQAPDAPANGQRALLLPAPGDQHTFGIVMVAEFFRHEGWEVEVGLAEGGTDAVGLAAREWFDVVGFSMGVESHLGALAQAIAALRRASLNRRVCIMVGGSQASRIQGLAGKVGADIVVTDGRLAPAMARSLLAASNARQ